MVRGDSLNKIKLFSKRAALLAIILGIIANLILANFALAKTIEITDKDVERIKFVLGFARILVNLKLGDAQLKNVLNTTLSIGATSTDISYGLLVLTALNEMELIDLVVSQRYKTVATEYFNSILNERLNLFTYHSGTGWDLLRVASGGITGPMSGLTLSTFAITNKVMQIFMAFHNIRTVKLYDGLWYYFDLRRINEPHQVAWEEAKLVMGFGVVINPLRFGKKQLDADYSQLEAQFASLWDKWGPLTTSNGIKEEAKQQVKEELTNTLVLAIKTQQFVEKEPEPSLLDRVKSGLNDLAKNLGSALGNIIKIAENQIQEILAKIKTLNPFGAAVVTLPQKEEPGEEEIKEAPKLSEVRLPTTGVEPVADFEEEVEAEAMPEKLEPEKMEKPEKEEEPEKEPKEKEIVFCQRGGAGSPVRNKIIFNEISWMGTGNSANDEWVELKNISGNPVNLSGWQILDKDQQIKIVFENITIPKAGFLLLERTDDSAVPHVAADLIYKGALGNSNEALFLFNKNCGLEDEIIANPDWPAGDNTEKRTMERAKDLSWYTYQGQGEAGILGTPKAENSQPKETEEIEKIEELKEEKVKEKSEPVYCSQENLGWPAQYPVIINEISWMGTEQSYANEWIELKNISYGSVSLSGWQILDKDLDIKIVFGSTDVITGQGFYLLERTDDSSVAGIAADKIYTGNLENSNESLRLFDKNCKLIDQAMASSNWPAGDNSAKKTMERSPELGWQTSSNISGTPKKENSIGYVATPPIVTVSAPPPALTYPKILISEIQISPIEKRFIELYNPNENEVNLTSWYIQRKTKNATSWASFVTSTQFEAKTIQPKSYFLISRTIENSDILLATLTLTEDNSIVLKNPNREIVDLVGWGQAQDFENAAFSQNPVSSQSLGRKWAGAYQDADNNQSDFEIQTPTPKAQNQKDLSPPETEILSSPPALTNQAQASFSFSSSEENSSFQCKLDNNGWQDCSSPKSYDALIDGQHIFQVKAADIFANTDPTPASFNWTIDTLISSPLLSLADLTTDSALYTNEQTVKASITDDEEAGAWFLSETQSAKPAVDDSNWQDSEPNSFNLSANNGTKTVYVWTKDGLGNVSTLGNSASIILDTTSPSVSLSSSLNDLTINLNWQGDDGQGSGILNYDLQYKIEAGEWQDLLTQTQETQTAFQAEAAKTYYFRARARDKATNQGDWSSEVSETTASAQPSLKVVINEISWMGTKASSTDEWIELHNPTKNPIDLTGWTLKAADGTPEIDLAGTIAANSFHLLERTNDSTISNISASLIYTGALGNEGEKLELRNAQGNLIDSVDCSSSWFKGNNNTKQTMERVNPTNSGSDSSNWMTNDGIIIAGLDADNNVIQGTPGQQNSRYNFSGKTSVPNNTAIRQDTIWFEEASPYVLAGQVNVFSGATLEIEPGVVIKFSQGKDSQISVSAGILKAKGNSNQPIIFTSLLDDLGDLEDLNFDFKDSEKDTNEDGDATSAYPGQWRRIDFRQNSQAELEQAIIRYGGYCGYYDQVLKSYQAIGVSKSSITLKDSTIEKNCGGGIEFSEDDADSPSQVDNVKFLDNRWSNVKPANITIKKGGPAIKNSSFEGNYWAIYVQGNTSAKIENNSFSQNYIPIYVQSGAATTIEQNTGQNNDTNGIVISASGTSYPAGIDTITWEKNQGLAFVIDSFFRIEQGFTLKIEPGTVIKLGHEYKNEYGIFQLYKDSFLRIEGELLAEGTADNLIIFTSFRDDEHNGDTNNDAGIRPANAGDWQNIDIRASATANLEHLKIRYAGAGGKTPLTIEPGANVTKDDATISIEFPLP